MTSEITFVKQQHKQGCGIAGIAMICGQTYEQVLDWFFEHGRKAGFEEVGIGYNDVFVYLNAHGFSYQKRFQFGLGNVPELIWPPTPFAESHLWSVPSPSGTHFLVMDRDGNLFDPLSGQIENCVIYGDPGYVIGVWKISNNL